MYWHAWLNMRGDFEDTPQEDDEDTTQEDETDGCEEDEFEDKTQEDETDGCEEDDFEDKTQEDDMVDWGDEFEDKTQEDDTGLRLMLVMMIMRGRFEIEIEDWRIDEGTRDQVEGRVNLAELEDTIDQMETEGTSCWVEVDSKDESTVRSYYHYSDESMAAVQHWGN
ncbi:uncharacterized protein MELLADRAFT_62214 [Melampsora larici-populina 98AG31]|uniref:Uncharacterized protein n=1 Tax=Melampsora larici-populina (strain 98AG31 / pathotype 3-4-7) TaxID=747676 RepID=F4RI13_MELLP|nr:uncharacterized protein MELLADRAFT_62214 [Melampsora larici-populina 98AG31]EGG07916.1 hypothetical protein MELLADRAFT_62214 [Melampsora larici-populina 98AG31]